MENILDTKETDYILENQLLIGRNERNLRKLLQCSVLDLEQLSGVQERTILRIEHECCCTSTTLAQSFEYYPKALGYKFNLLDFFKLVISAIMNEQSVKIEQLKGYTAEETVRAAPGECLLLLFKSNSLRPENWHIPQEFQEDTQADCKAAAIEHCKYIGLFEEELRWLSGLTREELCEKVHLTEKTIRAIEKQCHSRCVNLFKLLAFYSHHLNFNFSLRLLLDELLKAIEEGISLKAVIVDQSDFKACEKNIDEDKIILYTPISDKEELAKMATIRAENYIKFKKKRSRKRTK